MDDGAVILAAMDNGAIILAAGAMLAAGLAASLVAGRIRVPALVLFLGVGMLLGSDGLGLIEFDDYELARFLGIAALVLILFEGGLAAGWRVVRPVLGPALSLAVVGTMVTAFITGFAAAWLLDLSTLEGLLLGATLSATDGAAVFAVLRGSTLRRRLAHVLEGEAGFNDPVAILLVVGFIEWIQEPRYGVADMTLLFVGELGIGLAVGVLAGAAAVAALRRVELASAGLYPVLTLAVAALAYGGAAVLHGSGFLAVYIAGLALGDAQVPAKRTIVAFHEGLAWLSQVGMFLMLGLLVFPSRLGDVALEATLLALVLVFVSRPVATVVSLVPFGFSAREQAAIGWAGLRGAVPVVLATFPIIEGVTGSLEIFDLVFFAVLVSTVVQGATFQPIARRLGVTSDRPALPRPLAESGTIRGLGAQVLEYPIGPEDAIVGARVHELGLPPEALVSVIVREGEAVLPRGSTLLEGGDELHVLVRDAAAGELSDLVERWRHGPIERSRRRGPVPRPAGSIFSSRPWPRELGDPRTPVALSGVPVVEVLRVRFDEPASLVALDDGRFAVCGPTLAIGSREQISAWCRRRLRSVRDEDEREWLREAVGALAGY
jgi:cell volume regulation protein A